MKQVTLNKNSWHYKIYDYFVGGTPKSLCPYFWTLVALFVFSPAIFLIWCSVLIMKLIFDTFTRILNLVYKPKKKTYEEQRAKERKQEERRRKKAIFWNKVGDGLMVVVKYVLLPSLLLLIGYGVYLAIDKGKVVELLTVILVGVGFLVLIFVFGYLLSKYENQVSRAIAWPFRPIVKLFKITGMMIVGLYKKACPLINWKE